MIEERKKHALVLGCGRSGTSIFGELFQDTGKFRYFSEVSMDEIMSLNTSEPIAMKVPRPSVSFPADPFLSFPLETLLEKFSHDIQLYWIVRHPLDTICSLKVGIEQNWGHHPRPDDWEEWKNRSLVEKCAHHWNYINSVSYSAVCKRAKTVFFEDMIASPESFAEDVLGDIDLKNPMYRKWAERVQNTNNEAFVEALTSREYSREDHSKRVGRWKENLNANEVQQIISIVSETAKRFGYTLQS